MKAAISRINDLEIPLCLFFNSINRRRLINPTFRLISRLGDGVFWYTLMALLPLLYGMAGVKASLNMGLTAMLGLLLYKLMKSATRRPRPYAYSRCVQQGNVALDQFSFPSGHTLHAVSFATVLVHYFPEWWVIAVPFTALVGLSRLILGLHYPSDVLIGALIGYLLAANSLLLFNPPAL
ncbi:phosphatase PAP2 family protein [Granulosicoccaceae sp. 1_MG-2023]|nr:phosphatase PAP2 family protein [Granulosicoccaceae sp. 1_MG-2023]